MSPAELNAYAGVVIGFVLALAVALSKLAGALSEVRGVVTGIGNTVQNHDDRLTSHDEQLTAVAIQLPAPGSLAPVGPKAPGPPADPTTAGNDAGSAS